MSPLEEPIRKVLGLKNYINGEWVESKPDKVLNIVNPATQKTVARVPASTPEEVKAAVEAAKKPSQTGGGHRQ